MTTGSQVNGNPEAYRYVLRHSRTPNQSTTPLQTWLMHTGSSSLRVVGGLPT